MVLCHSMNTGSVVGIHTAVATLKPYLMQNNLFEPFALTGSGVVKNFGCKCHCSCLKRISHLVEFPLPNIFFYCRLCWPLISTLRTLHI